MFHVKQGRRDHLRAAEWFEWFAAGKLVAVELPSAFAPPAACGEF